ncbi:hypothetical protein [Aureimonas glaciei]|uniref:Uncharacterized protein n=1 Tax=Aureimonas glaciei TaxID=1776957 RepID=A0A917D7W6_9HYPH|nr:hypothetical protein [Aureimonas glaciei]GGD09276.1 hypothetical protein GCM10011335_10180 [Aureimonas glaciei]
MDAQSFDDLLLRHGPDIDAWPEQHRSAALRLVAEDQAVHARLAADRRIADLVSSAVTVPAHETAILLGVIRAAAAAKRRSRAAQWGEQLDAWAGRWLAPATLAGTALGWALLAMAGGYGLAPDEAAGTDALFVAIAEGRGIADAAFPGEAALPPEGL